MTIENRIREILKSENKFSEASIANATITKQSEKEYAISVPISVQEFINTVLIIELLGVVKASSWLGFVSIGSGIEFLGKCIDIANPMDWDKSGVSSTNFNTAVNQLDGINNYKHLINRGDGFDLYNQFRCGLIHGMAPKSMVTLSHGVKEEKNLIEKNGKVNFNIDDLYLDFKLACEDVMSRTFTEPNKMNKAKITINIVATIVEPVSVRTETTQSINISFSGATD